MKCILVYILFIGLLVGCNSDEEVILNTGYVKPTNISMDCINTVSFYFGFNLEVVVNSQRSYDSLIYTRFQKPLDDLRNAWYPKILEDVMHQYPGLTDSQYAILAKENLNKLFPFAWVKGCTNPSVDFHQFTLLGLNANAGGCESPSYDASVYRDDIKREITFKLKIIEHGNCSMLSVINDWILIPKIPDYYIVKFEREFTQEGR